MGRNTFAGCTKFNIYIWTNTRAQWITLGESVCTLAALMSLAFYPWVLYIPLPSHASNSKELLTPLHTFLYIRPVIQSGPQILLHSKTCNTPIMSRISFSAGIWDNFSKLHHTVLKRATKIWVHGSSWEMVECETASSSVSVKQCHSWANCYMFVSFVVFFLLMLRRD